MQKKRRRELHLSSAQNKGANSPPKNNGTMIQFVNVLLKAIFVQGRDFPWKKPSKCPRCGHWRVWGHGYVQAIFHGFDEPLWLKRYRCPNCGCIIQMRPVSHFSRFQSPKEIIRRALKYRITHMRWPPDSHPARGRHWLTNLKRQTKAHLTETWKAGLMAAYDKLIQMGRNPVSRSI